MESSARPATTAPTSPSSRRGRGDRQLSRTGSSARHGMASRRLGRRRRRWPSGGRAGDRRQKGPCPGEQLPPVRPPCGELGRSTADTGTDLVTSRRAHLSDTTRGRATSAADGPTHRPTYGPTDREADARARSTTARSCPQDPSSRGHQIAPAEDAERRPLTKRPSLVRSPGGGSRRSHQSRWREPGCAQRYHAGGHLTPETVTCADTLRRVTDGNPRSQQRRLGVERARDRRRRPRGAVAALTAGSTVVPFDHPRWVTSVDLVERAAGRATRASRCRTSLLADSAEAFGVTPSVGDRGDGRHRLASPGRRVDDAGGGRPRGRRAERARARQVAAHAAGDRRRRRRRRSTGGSSTPTDADDRLAGRRLGFERRPGSVADAPPAAGRAALDRGDPPVRRRPATRRRGWRSTTGRSPATPNRAAGPSRRCGGDARGVVRPRRVPPPRA